jgi:hypothetical protein
MAVLQTYALIQFFVNGAPVVQKTRITRSLTANRTPVNLMGEGLSGYTDGIPELTHEFDAPVPIGGHEFDYEGMLTRNEFVETQIFIGARSYAGLGVIQSAVTTQEAGGAASTAVSWTGAATPVE